MIKKYITILLTLSLIGCTKEKIEQQTETYTQAVVRIGTLNVGGNTGDAVNNESYCGDVHVINYSSGLRRKYTSVDDYMTHPNPIAIEVATGTTSRIYVIANLNRYWRAMHGTDITENDFPGIEADLERWVFSLSKAQIELHKSNTTDALFLIYGRSADGAIITDGSDEPLELPVQLSRLFSKVDVKLWHDPSVTNGSLDMTDARIFFSQYVPRVRPFAADGGESYIPDVDNPIDPYLYTALPTQEGTPTATQSEFYCLDRNYLPSNNAISKLDATYVILQAKWNGKTAFWKGIVSTEALGAPYRLESNFHLTVLGKIMGEGKENPDITEEMTLSITLKIEEWTVNNLDDIETGN